jgi:pyrrolidone-carboxylate peptidase
MKVILTGFMPFGDLGVNPSQLVVKRIAECQHELSGIELTAEILPTAFADAGERIRQLIRRVTPDAVLSIGVAASRARHLTVAIDATYESVPPDQPTARRSLPPPNQRCPAAHRTARSSRYGPEPAARQQSFGPPAAPDQAPVPGK